MDAVTQGVLGATVGQAALGHKMGNRAGVVALLGGMAPDLDLVIRSSRDPLMALVFHRHFTHALVFIPVGGLVVGTLAWLLFRRKLGWRMAVAAATIGYATAGLLDVMTSYGTQYLWPFTDVRLAWDWIGIIDLFFTLPLVIGTAVAFKRRTRLPALVGLGVALAYLLLGIVQHERAQSVQQRLAQARGHRIERARAMPTPLNLVLWRSIYEHDGKLQADAIRVGLFTGSRVWEGGQVDKVEPADLDPDLGPATVAGRDVRRFDWFTGGWLFRHRGTARDENGSSPVVLGDFRYTLMPNGTSPLWGVEVDPASPDAHVARVNFRDGFADKLGLYWKMILGTAEGGRAAP